MSNLDLFETHVLPNVRGLLMGTLAGWAAEPLRCGPLGLGALVERRRKVLVDTARLRARTMLRASRLDPKTLKEIDRTVSQAIVDDWNLRCPEGTRVGFRFTLHDAQEIGETVTTSAAYLSRGIDHTPMVRIEARSGGWALTHLRVIGAPAGPSTSAEPPQNETSAS